MIPKINSAHGADTRNLINRAIEVLNRLGIDVQTLVAEGQLTEDQYAKLIKEVNGMIAKGEVSVHDINKNKGKIDQTFLTEELLQQIAGTAEINAVPVDGSLTTEKYADNSVTIEKTAFTEGSKNIASGSYLEWGLVDYNGALHLQRDRYGFLTRGKLIEVIPNTEYTASRQGDGNRFAIVGFTEHPSFSIENLYTKPDEIIIDDRTKEFHTFTTGENTNYIYFYVDQAAMEPEIQVEYGDELTPYTSPHVIGKKYVEPAIKETIKENLDTVTIIEDIEKGYPERPDAPSVIWIGNNEPTEAQPYDEWREAGGYIYYEDFSEDEVGSFPSKWSKKWVESGEIKTQTSSLSPSGLNVLQWAGSLARSAIDFSKVSEDQNREDSEIYFVSRDVGVISSTGTSAVLRGSGGSGSETGYVIGPRPRADFGNVEITKYYNGELSTLGTFSSTVDFSEYHCVRARIDGDVIKGKVWQYGEIEPDWQIEVTDPASLPSGFVGIFKFIRENSYIDTVGIGTGGMRAPTKKVF